MFPRRTTASTSSPTTPQSGTVDPAAAWRGVQPSSSAVNVAPAVSSTLKLQHAMKSPYRTECACKLSSQPELILLAEIDLHCYCTEAFNCLLLLSVTSTVLVPISDTEVLNSVAKPRSPSCDQSSQSRTKEVSKPQGIEWKLKLLRVGAVWNYNDTICDTFCILRRPTKAYLSKNMIYW